MNNYEFSHHDVTPQSISSNKILIETHHQSPSGDNGVGHGCISNANMVVSQLKFEASLLKPNPPEKVTEGFQTDSPIFHPQTTPYTSMTNTHTTSSIVYQPFSGEGIDANFKGIGCPSWLSFSNTNQVEITFSGELRPYQEPVECYELLNLTNNLQEGLHSENICVGKGQWTDEEDRRLKELVKEFGEKRWKKLSEKMLGRVGNQCRERWINHLRPHIKKDPWSEEEEKMLISAHKRLDNSWADIAKEIPGRAENSIKNHWNVTRKKLCRRRNGYKRPRKNTSNKSTPLLEYMNDYYSKKTSTTISEHPTSTTIPTSIDTSIEIHHTMPTPRTSHGPIAIDDTSNPVDLTLTRIYQQPITHDQDDDFIQFCEKLLQQ